MPTVFEKAHPDSMNADTVGQHVVEPRIVTCDGLETRIDGTQGNNATAPGGGGFE